MLVQNVENNNDLVSSSIPNSIKFFSKKPIVLT